jgi:4-hydroxybenzoate polyprenyltransferase
VAAAAVASIADAPAGVAVRLGLGMLFLQFAIGAANDYVDAAADGLAKPGKAIPSGQLSRRAAGRVFFIAAALGLLFGASVGWGALTVGLVGLADGLIYDLRLKGTPLSWMPFAMGVGLLPVYAWLGARGSMPLAFLGVVTLAVLAGLTLALANAYADLEKDRLSGTASAATFLGSGRTLVVGAAALAIVQLVALATTLPIGGAQALLLAEACGCALGWLGIGLAALPGGRGRSLSWEIQAVGVLILGAAWLAGLSSAGLLRA